MYTVAGVSRCKGKIKVRFCSDAILRIKNLHKQGDTEIQLIELPNPMTKEEACHYLILNPAFGPYAREIGTVMGKKGLPSKSKQPIMIAEVEKDPEIELIKQLAEV